MPRAKGVLPDRSGHGPMGDSPVTKYTTSPPTSCATASARPTGRDRPGWSGSATRGLDARRREPSAGRAACGSGRRRRPRRQVRGRAGRRRRPDRGQRGPAVVARPGSRRPGRRGRERTPARWPPRSSRSPSALPPVTMRCGATPARNRSMAWSSRAANTGEGRPSYWAAPRTTIASAGRSLIVGRPACQTRKARDQPRAQRRRRRRR